MIDLNDIRPVTDFNRDTKAYIKRLKKTGRPEVLTVNGQAEVVVQSAKAYQKLLEAAGLADSLAAIRQGTKEIHEGKGRPMREFLEELANQHGFSLK